jgi:hypothetical protein
MKTINLCIALLCLAISACSDDVKLEYSNYAEAEDDNLFNRGWLPSIIPKSSEQIVMNNDLDLNTSEGSFVYGSHDLEEFLGRLKRAPGLDISGHEAHTYQNWIFYIHVAKLQCKYWLVE